MVSAVAQRWERWRNRLGLEADWYLVLVAAVIGAVTALVGWSFIWLIHEVLVFVEWCADQGSTWYVLIIVIPVVGAGIAGAIIYYLASEARGHGVPEVLFAIHARKGLIKARVAIAKWTSAIFTIGLGGSAGAEGPIVQIGSAMGSKVGQMTNLTPQQRTTLLGCGAAAGISAVFNAPIAGIFFVLEILLRDFSIKTFTPIVIASVFAAAVMQAVNGGNEPIFSIPVISAGIDSQPFQPHEIVNYIVMGFVCGLAALAFVKSLYWVEDLYEKLRLHPIVKPITGAFMLGLLGIAWVLLARPDLGEGRLPPFFSNGYPVVEELLDPAFYEQRTQFWLFTTVLMIGAGKGLATCMTLGSGGSGGIFAPSLMMGAATGGAFGIIVDSLDWYPHANPAYYALVGMAAVVAASTHAPLTAILIVYEITRTYEIILPLMLAAIISTVFVRFLMHDSIYTLKLTRRGIHLGAMADLTILRRMVVNDVPLAPPVTVHADESAQRLLDLSEQRHVHDFVVTNRKQQYVGLVTSEDLKEALVYREAIPLLQIGELLRTDLPTVHTDETLDVVLDKFSRHDVESLAVLDEQREGAVLGLITRSRLMRQYQNALHEE
jgi:CIC family chloride channel protein